MLILQAIHQVIIKKNHGTSKMEVNVTSGLIREQNKTEHTFQPEQSPRELSAECPESEAGNPYLWTSSLEVLSIISLKHVSLEDPVRSL